MSEASLQAASAQYFKLRLPKTFLAIHCANEGRRSWAQGKRLKAQGMTAGVPDWLIMGSQPHYTRGPDSVALTWAIELKARRGSLSPAQKAFHKRLEAAGVPVCVCRSLDDIEAQLKQWGVLP